MEKFNCLIIEDEPLAAEILQDYIAQIPFLECKAVCRDAIYAMRVLQNEKIDVLFLDIHLPKIKGLDFLKTLKNPPQAIVTTAYRKYALDGYELNIVDYLLKPISFNRFLAAVNKLRKNVNGEASLTPPASKSTVERGSLFINVNKKKIKIFLDEILYIESRREYISIVTNEKSVLAKFQLSEMEGHLDSGKFLRIHRSFIVAKEKVSAFNAVEVEINNQRLPIGRSYKGTVLKALAHPI